LGTHWELEGEKQNRNFIGTHWEQHVKVEHTWAPEAYERDLRHRAKMFFGLPWPLRCESYGGDDPQTDLVKFGYKLNMEVNLLLKKIKPVKQIWRFVLKLWSNYGY
jgi:hypothetical protein